MQSTLLQPAEARSLPASQAADGDCVERQDRNLAAWIQLAALAVFAFLAVPFFSGQVYVADDLGEYHLPLRNFYSQQLAHGEAFDWLPTLYNGFYLTGEGQAGTYHPLHLLLYRWLPLGAAFDLELLLSYPFMLVGMAAFLRRRLQSRPAAWFGALVFTCSGFNLLHFVHPNAIAVVAHIPWLLWAIDVSLGPSTLGQARAAELAFGLLTASQLLLGYPQYVWFSLIAEVAVVAWRLHSRDVTHRPWRLAAAALCGMLAGAVQWLPTLDALNSSVRRTAEADFANSGSLHPLNLVQFLAPYLLRTRVVGQNTHELGLYFGAVPLLLFLWMVLNRKRLGSLRWLANAAIVLALGAIVLAFGQHGFLYELQSYLPVVNRFRFPCRAIVLVHLAMAVGAALGFYLLIQRGDEGDGRARPSTRALWVVVAASALLAALGPVMWGPFVSPAWEVWIGPSLFVAAAVLVSAAVRAGEAGRRAILYALVVMAAADQAIYGASYSIYAHERTADLNQFVAATPVPPSDGRPLCAPRVALGGPCGAEQLQPGNRILLSGYGRVDGYSGLVPARELDYRQPEALRLAGAQWSCHCETDSTLGDAGTVKWVELAPVGRARLVTDVVQSDRAQPLPAFPDVAVVESHCDLPVADPGKASMLIDRPGRIAVATSAPTRQLLVLAESYHAGWQATLDGTDCPALRVNGDFLGCLVEAGRHEVQFRFQPASLRYGAMLSACGLGFIVCLFALRRSRRPSRS